jgi:hypothetical protein
VASRRTFPSVLQADCESNTAAALVILGLLSILSIPFLLFWFSAFSVRHTRARTRIATGLVTAGNRMDGMGRMTTMTLRGVTVARASGPDRH